MGMDDFWEMKSEEQQSPHRKDPLQEAVMDINQTYPQILKLCKAKLGSYVEIAFEWSWEEAISMLELLDVVDEIGSRDMAKSKAIESATR